MNRTEAILTFELNEKIYSYLKGRCLPVRTAYLSRKIRKGFSVFDSNWIIEVKSLPAEVTCLQKHSIGRNEGGAFTPTCLPAARCFPIGDPLHFWPFLKRFGLFFFITPLQTHDLKISFKH